MAVSLSGSGPTCFAFFTDKKAAKVAFRQLKQENTECYLVKPLAKALIIE
jgi:4-diphosphocytidyl-2C-methyl-D-erythritol kinase